MLSAGDTATGPVGSAGAGSVAIDPADMLGAVRGLPDQLEAAWARVEEFILPQSHRAPAAIICTGMGGSAIAADVAVGALAEWIRIPVLINRDSTLPAWADAGVLLVASSFSGDTEETLSAWDAAGRCGCPRIALTAGGALAERAIEAGEPIVRLIPGGQPRAAFGQSFASVVGVLRAAGVIVDPDAAITAAIAAMRDLVTADESPVSDVTPPTADEYRLPTETADALIGHLPIIFVAPGIEPIGRRWRGQMNENAKTCALLETLPEAHHNAVEGLPGLLNLGLSPIALLLSASRGVSAGTRRIGITRTLMRELAIECVDVAPPAELEGTLAAHLWLVQYADLTSVHLARSLGIDPTPIPTIMRMKALGEP